MALNCEIKVILVLGTLINIKCCMTFICMKHHIVCIRSLNCKVKVILVPGTLMSLLYKQLNIFCCEYRYNHVITYCVENSWLKEVFSNLKKFGELLLHAFWNYSSFFKESIINVTFILHMANHFNNNNSFDAASVVYEHSSRR